MKLSQAFRKIRSLAPGGLFALTIAAVSAVAQDETVPKYRATQPGQFFVHVPFVFTLVCMLLGIAAGERVGIAYCGH